MPAKIVKIILIGPPQVGKTLLYRYADPTVTKDELSGTVMAEFKEVKPKNTAAFQLYDSPGDRNKPLTHNTCKILYPETDAIILVIKYEDALSNNLGAYQAFLTEIQENLPAKNYQQKLRVFVTYPFGITIAPEEQQLAKIHVNSFLTTNRYLPETPIHFTQLENQKAAIDNLTSVAEQSILETIKTDIQSLLANPRISLKEKKEQALNLLKTALADDRLVSLNNLRKLYNFIFGAKNPNSAVHRISEERHFLRFFDPSTKGETVTWARMLDLIACQIAKKIGADHNQEIREDFRIIANVHQRYAPCFVGTCLAPTRAQRVYHVAAANPEGRPAP